ncbi:hypothetical protein LP316_12755 [Thalassotalea sp. LPB0316]|uniref:hypothetical protein n=1 Tax=Thalassotalea sp. LPB0316 TaxID=2769490 RepID=UPI00186942AC|nr:hypothetical protein [Thalassotalea sp. LPB0316]QOL25161.1 hypothetical protein LP316_12755 [Thalassotalea sp. LPB0316]
MNVHTIYNRENVILNQYTQTLANIYSAHKTQNKWIMMIDAEDNALKSISANNDLDAKKILKVHSNKVKIEAESIHKALTKGNCSAVVLCKQLFTPNQIAWLREQAQRYNTDFIVLESTATVH